MKKILIYFMFMFMVFAAFSASAAELEAYVDYDNSALNVCYTTEVGYGPMVSVIVYKAATPITKPQDFIDIANPREVYPLENSGQIRTVAESRADYKGNMQMSVNMKNGFENGYYIVSASQSGSVEAKCSSVIYFEDGLTAKETLNAVNAANSAELDNIIKQKPLFFGDNKNCKKYNSSVLSLLFSIKDKDFGGSFRNSSEVRKAFRAAVCINDINLSPANAQKIIEEIAGETEIDTDDPNYVFDKASVIKIFADTILSDKCESIADVKKAFRASVGVALVNRSKQEDIDNIIREYGDAIGIQYADYMAKCNLYTGTNIDKIFVGASFKTSSEMVKAYTDRVAVLADAEKKPQPNPSRDNGGSAGGGKITGKPQTNSTEEDAFTDLPQNHWAYSAIVKMKKQKILSGYEDNTFQPDKSVTREEFVKIAVSALGYYSIDAQCDFDDVGTEKWSYPYIASAVQRGLIYGITEKRFGAEMNITREDAAVILYRVAGEKISYSEPRFADSEEISDYAKEAVGALYANGIVKGVDEQNFVPKNPLTRAQTAVLIDNIINYINSL